jgi:hypothetical protein
VAGVVLRFALKALHNVYAFTLRGGKNLKKVRASAVCARCCWSQGLL